jgi:hypothetical protein
MAKKKKHLIEGNLGAAVVLANGIPSGKTGVCPTHSAMGGPAPSCSGGGAPGGSSGGGGGGAPSGGSGGA